MSETGLRRRLTTILASDVAEYSRLMSTDEELTLTTFKSYKAIILDLINRHRGRVFNTAGDAILAEFGSTVEGVRCAMSVQEELSGRNAELPGSEQLHFRIGINVGDVMVEDGDLFGDGVNVAARLEGLAEPGGICISGTAYEQVKDKLTIGFREMGVQKVKNISHPITAFALVEGSAAGMQSYTGSAGWKRRWLTAIGFMFIIVAGAGLYLALWHGGGSVRLDKARGPNGSFSGAQLKLLLTDRTVRISRRARQNTATVVFRLTLKKGGMLGIVCTVTMDETPDQKRRCGRPPDEGTWEIQESLICWTMRRPNCFNIRLRGKIYILNQVPAGHGFLSGPITMEKR